VLRVRDGMPATRPDTLTVEEPLEIRVAGKALSITMRTPGDDFDLAAGFLVGEGVVRAAAGVHSIRCLREDVGRRNAVDNVVGWAVRDGRLPLSGTAVMVSGRASFEPVQKAVSAPSSLAVDLAAEVGLTLVGFLRGTSMNVYTRPERLGLQSS
jgi:formate dehydrogenase assembly factor FdhD